MPDVKELIREGRHLLSLEQQWNDVVDISNLDANLADFCRCHLSTLLDALEQAEARVKELEASVTVSHHDNSVVGMAIIAAGPGDSVLLEGRGNRQRVTFGPSARLLKEHEELEAENAAFRDRFKRPIVCLCGSTRFKTTWVAENARLTNQGEIVLSVGRWGHCEPRCLTDEEKKSLDETHKRKIDLCDYVFVLDVGGYIGESTQSEIAYAHEHGKPVRYLSQEFPDYVEPVDPLEAENESLKNENARLKASIGPIRQTLDEAQSREMTLDDIADYTESIQRLTEENAALKSEVESLRKDAERYR